MQTGQKIPWNHLILFGVVLLAGLLAANQIFPRMVSKPGSVAHGSFAYMLYGQAVGGAGWKYHAQALGTSDPQIVLMAAIQKMLTYPQGFLIGSLKAYRDFFSIGRGGIYDLFSLGSRVGDLLFWLACLGFTLVGLPAYFKKLKESPNLLMDCMAIGILLSVPFLPPIDGGKRFYAGAVPFFYGLISLGLSVLLRVKPMPFSRPPGWIARIPPEARIAVVMLFAANLIAPVALLGLGKRVDPVLVDPCPSGQAAYTVSLRRGSSLDILPDGHPDCVRAPRLCLRQFEKYGLEKDVDDFYVKILDLARASDAGIRLAAVHDLNSLEYYFFVMPLDEATRVDMWGTLTGCALPIRTQFQTIRLAKTSHSAQ